jgi:hypothetical protein
MRDEVTVEVDVMPGRFLLQRIPAFIGIHRMVLQKRDVSLVESDHRGRKEKDRMIIDHPVSIESPAPGRPWRYGQTGKQQENAEVTDADPHTAILPQRPGG